MKLNSKNNYPGKFAIALLAFVIVLISNSTILSCPLDVEYLLIGGDCNIVGNRSKFAAHVKDGQWPYKITVYYSLGDSMVVNDTIFSLHVQKEGYPIKIIDATGCSHFDTLIVANAMSIKAEMLKQVSCDTCADGSAKASVTGFGEPPFVYRWNDDNQQTTAVVTGLEAGVYSVRVTDSIGCFNADTIQLTVCDLEVDITLDYQEGCDIIGNTQAHMYVGVTGGMPPYSFEWNQTWWPNEDTIEYQEEGTYTVQVVDSMGCERSKTITVESAIKVAVNLIRPLSCATCSDAEAECVVSGFGQPPYTYRWSDSDQQTTAIATGLSSGTYIVNVTDYNGCWKRDTISIDHTIGIEDYGNTYPVTLYPNPVFTKLIVSVENQKDKAVYQYRILDISGKEILRRKSTESQFSVDVSNFTSGIYLFELSKQGGERIINKFSVLEE